MPANVELDHVFAKLYQDSRINNANPGRVFYFSRHGESMNNISGKIGGNAVLSPNGQKYAKTLGNYFNTMNLENLQVYLSFGSNQRFVYVNKKNVNKRSPREIPTYVKNHPGPRFHLPGFFYLTRTSDDT